MRTRAAVALEVGKAFEVMQVNLVGPKAGEVLVEIKATGLCHTDSLLVRVLILKACFQQFWVMKVRASLLKSARVVTSLEVDDHVIPLYTPECRTCNYCLNPKTNLCQQIRSTQGQGVMPDGTTHFSMLDGTPILHYIGCGVTTGIGAVINTAKVEIGSTAIVFGLGSIGLNVVQGLRLAGADQIVGVDLNDGKVKMATQFGMTDFVNPSKVEGDLVSHLVDLTGGGGDYTFDATGNVDVMRMALESAHKGCGAKVLSSV